ncbi:MAG: hypothetical protein H6748_03620 [Spirochaetaceae bacterium]|nr:hypothetical protein [Spirochaetaceae bacterium]HPG26868.1 hypothetical protein [Myxococcota bacterium]
MRRNFPTPGRPRGGLSFLLLLCATIDLSGSSASAQLSGGVSLGTTFPSIPLETDANVAVPELWRMLPNGEVLTERLYEGNLRWRTRRTVSLFAVTKQGLSTRFWDTDSRKWSDWDHLGNPTGAPLQRVSNSGDTPGFDFGLPLLRGWGVGQPDWIAYQGVAKPSAGALPDFETAVMQVDAPSGVLAYAGERAGVTTAVGPTVPSGWSYFNPQAGFDSIDPVGVNGYRRHVFGTGMPRNVVSSGRFRAQPSLPLVEMRQKGANGTPVWIDHGKPGNAIGVTAGPGSTTSVFHDYLDAEDPDARVEQHYVFVATDPVEYGTTGLNGSEVAYLHGDGTSFAWSSLGSPGGNLVGAPVALTYYTKAPIAGGLGRVIVVAVTRRDGRFELVMRYHDGNGWTSGWSRWGAPAELRGEAFRMTSSVVWYDGPSNDLANLRISFFGYSEQSSIAGGLVELHWNGGSWGWKPMRFAPNGQSLATDHAVVVDEGTRDRVIVFARTYTGRILEWVEQYENGSSTSAGWNDLSTEPIVIRRLP